MPPAPSPLGPAPTALRDRAAQLVFARLGSNLPPPVPAAEDARRVAALLERCPLGGLILFNGHRDTTPGVMARLQRASRHPLLLGADIERGAGQQIEGATVFPHAMAFGALGEGGEAAAEEAARITAREARACGLHLAFAPVADVHLFAENPIISTRAFSSEPERAARLVQAFVRGCRAEGLLTTAKHFPGHGRTTTDTHAELPTVRAARAVLEEMDLVPFRAAIAAGVDAMMTAHVAFPALGTADAPATLAPSVLRSLLREEMGFGGPVITDSLLMGAVQGTHAGAGAQAVALVSAGVDVLLDPDDPEAVVDGLVKGVEAGRLPERRLDEALGRVWALKEKMHRRHGAEAFATEAASVGVVGAAAHGRAAASIARRAVTVLDAAPGVLPLGPASRVLVVRLAARASADGSALEAAVREAFPEAAYRTFGPEEDRRGDAALVLEAAREVEAVVLAMAVEPAAWQAFGLGPAQARLARDLVGAAAGRGQAVIAAALGSPHVLEALPPVAARLCAYSDVAVSQRALVRAVAGRA